MMNGKEKPVDASPSTFRNLPADMDQLAATKTPIKIILNKNNSFLTTVHHSLGSPTIFFFSTELSKTSPKSSSSSAESMRSWPRGMWRGRRSSISPEHTSDTTPNTRQNNIWRGCSLLKKGFLKGNCFFNFIYHIDDLV